MACLISQGIPASGIQSGGRQFKPCGDVPGPDAGEAEGVSTANSPRRDGSGRGDCSIRSVVYIPGLIPWRGGWHGVACVVGTCGHCCGRVAYAQVCTQEMLRSRAAFRPAIWKGQPTATPEEEFASCAMRGFLECTDTQTTGIDQLSQFEFSDPACRPDPKWRGRHSGRTRCRTRSFLQD